MEACAHTQEAPRVEVTRTRNERKNTSYTTKINSDLDMAVCCVFFMSLGKPLYRINGRAYDTGE